MASDNTSGTKYDAGKTRLDLFPGDVLFAISDILTFGANKYADRNWEKGMSWGRVFGALMRHMWSWWQGKGPTNESFVFGSLDEETKRSHLWHAGCCIAFLIAYEMRGIGTDDRPSAARDTEDKEIGTAKFDGGSSSKPRAPDTVEPGWVSDLQADLQSGKVFAGTDGIYRNSGDRRVVGYDSAGNRLDGLATPLRVYD